MLLTLPQVLHFVVFVPFFDVVALVVVTVMYLCSPVAVRMLVSCFPHDEQVLTNSPSLTQVAFFATFHPLYLCPVASTFVTSVFASQFMRNSTLSNQRTEHRSSHRSPTLDRLSTLPS